MSDDGEKERDDGREWPDLDTDPIAWVKFSLGLIVDEAECTLSHMEAGVRTDEESDYFRASLHLSNMMEGVRQIANVLFTNILTDDEQIQVALNLAETKLGIPLELVELGGGVVAITPQNIDVPDTVEGLFNGGE